MTIHTETLKKEYFLIQSFKVQSWHLSLEHRERSFKILPAPLKKRCAIRQKGQVNPNVSLLRFPSEKNPLQEWECFQTHSKSNRYFIVFFQTTWEALLPSWTVLRPHHHYVCSENVEMQKKGQRKGKTCRTVQTADLDGWVRTKSLFILGDTVSIEKKLQSKKWAQMQNH